MDLIVQEKVPTKKENIAKLTKAIDSGATSVKELSRASGILRTTISAYIHSGDLDIAPMITEQHPPLLRWYFNMLSKEEKSTIKRPKNWIVRRIPERDELILTGAPLDEIAERFSITRQAIHQYAKKTGLLKIWREKFNLHKIRRLEAAEEITRYDSEKKQALEEILGLVQGLVIKKAKPEDRWAYQNAFDYRNAKKNLKTNISLDSLFTVLKRYELAVKKNKSFSLLGLSKGIDISYQGVRGVLEALGLKNLCKIRERMLTPPKKKEVIRRAYFVNMNHHDLAFFIGIPHYTIRSYFSMFSKELGERSKVNPPVPFQSRNRNRPTYALISQVYEALDLGFDKEETCELLDMKEVAIDYIISNRKLLEEKIIQTLRIIYPNKEITTPYNKA